MGRLAANRNLRAASRASLLNDGNEPTADGHPRGGRRKHRITAAVVWVVVGVPLTIMLMNYVAPWQRRLPKGTFRQIELGLSQEQVFDVLGGSPDWEGVMLADPESFATNLVLNQQQLRAQGYRDFLWQQWDGVESTVTVMSDDRGKAVARWESGGQKRHFGAKLERMFFEPRLPKIARPAKGFIKEDQATP